MFLDISQLRASSTVTTEGHRLSVPATARFSEVLVLFRARPELRLLAVVDEHARPLGAIRELDVRALLFNPYGHSLMLNPAFASSLDHLIRVCPVAEAGASSAALLQAYAASPSTEGLILTRAGVFERTLDAQDFVRLAARRQTDIAQERAARAERIDVAGRAFTDDVAALVAGLSEVAGDVDTLAHQLGRRAGETSDGTASVARAAGETARALDEIAVRGRELAAALGEIGTATADARRIRGEARAVVAEAGQRVEALATQAHSIDDMLALIQQIAAKTNLLALNAGIEAARAGDAGRGFAVVADEVKSLSRQTGQAAKDIADKIALAHGVLDAVVDGHLRIEGAIGAIGDTAQAIDSALDAQHGATRVIASEVAASVAASEAIGDRIATISGGAAALGGDAEALRALSATLAGAATRLHRRADEFVQLAAA